MWVRSLTGRIPTDHGDAAADPGRGPIIDPAVGPTAESAGAEATAARPCPIVAGISATVYALSNIIKSKKQNKLLWFGCFYESDIQT